MSLAGFAVANIAAFVSFLPLIQILLPLKAAAIAPQAAAALLGTAAAVGAGVAGIANVAAGWLSDRTRSRWGRRRPWIIAGTVGVLTSYAVILSVHTALGLIVAFGLFQLTFNMVFAPLLALIPDRIPVERRGTAAAVVALGFPLGTAIGAVVVGALVTDPAARYSVLGAMVLVGIVPFALRLPRDPPVTPRPPARTGRWLSRNFALGWLARACVIGVLSMAQLYLLFYVAGLRGGGQAGGAARGVAVLGVVYGVGSSAAGIVAGRLSDRMGRRKPFVIGGAMAIGIGMIALAAAPSWSIAIIAYGVFAIGAGCYNTTELALIVGLLPSHDQAARDLGVVNVSNVAMQVVAPLAVMWLLAIHGATLHWAYAIGGVVAVIGAALVHFIRGVP